MSKYKSNERLLVVKGSAFDRNYQQGRAFRHLLPKIIQAAASIPMFPSWLQSRIPQFIYRILIERGGKNFLVLHRPLLENHSGVNLLDGVWGLAEGFGVSLATIYGLNSLEIISSKLPYTLGCSSLAFSARQTGRGPLIAYNHDFPEALGNFLFVRQTLPQKGYASLNLTYPPLLGSIGGINERGLAVSLNHAYVTNVSDGSALLITLLVQQCLERCKNVLEALALIKKTPVPNGSMMTLLDGAGHRAVVELSPTKKIVRWGVGTELLVTFNKYKIPQMAAVEVPVGAIGRGPFAGHLIHEHSFKREERFAKIFKPKKKYAERHIHKLLSDHAQGRGGFGTICRHDPLTASTLCSVLFHPKEKNLQVIFGNPCKGKYKSYAL